MKNYIILVVTLFMCSCSKDSTTPPISQIDHMIFRNTATKQETVAKVVYDDLGRITEFGGESYLYNANSQVNQISLYTHEGRLDLNNLIIRYNYKVDYDQKNRLLNHRTPTYDRDPITTGGLYATVALYPRHYTLHYENNAKIPSSMEHNYVSNPLFGVPSSYQMINIVQTNTYTVADGNIIRRKTVVKGEKGSVWTPPTDEIIERMNETAFGFDNKPNVYQALFNSLGFIPESFLDATHLERSFYYSKNNIVSLQTENSRASVDYNYDKQGRIISLKAYDNFEVHIVYK